MTPNLRFFFGCSLFAFDAWRSWNDFLLGWLMCKSILRPPGLLFLVLLFPVVGIFQVGLFSNFGWFLLQQMWVSFGFLNLVFLLLLFVLIAEGMNLCLFEKVENITCVSLSCSGNIFAAMFLADFMCWLKQLFLIFNSDL